MLGTDEKSTQISRVRPFRALKQPFGGKACVAYVAAMATGADVEEFKRFCRHFDTGNDQEPFTDKQLYGFLLVKGYLAGQAFSFKDRLPYDLPDRIMVPLELIGQAAYVKVTVPGHPEWHHAVFWDGQQVWDPRSDVRDGKPLSEYQIILWVPINSIDQCAG